MVLYRDLKSAAFGGVFSRWGIRRSRATLRVPRLCRYQEEISGKKEREIGSKRVTERALTINAAVGG
jgi:hypothetical protein